MSFHNNEFNVPRASTPMVAAILPCYKTRDHVLHVIARMPSIVQLIICVDDGCPQKTGQYIIENCSDKRVRVIRHPVNQGVGGAVCTGYKAALHVGADICVKVDSDGQMDASLIPYLIAPIIAGSADYCKGNRFANIEDVKGMPKVRIFGNVGLSFFTKLSSGYWNIFDPTNGFTAIHARIVERLPLNKISKRYFFESDMLFRMNTLRACVIDVPMTAHYGEEISNLQIRRILVPFTVGNFKNFFKRIFYNYFLRDFSLASVHLLIGLFLGLLGCYVGVHYWVGSIRTGVPATAGQVMMAALPLVVSLQLLLSFLHSDIEHTPSIPQHPLMAPEPKSSNDVLHDVEIPNKAAA